MEDITIGTNMKEEQILKLKNTDLLEIYIKKVFLLDFYYDTWFRWLQLLENASESIEVLESIIETIDDKFATAHLQDYKMYYEDAEEKLKTKLDRLSKILSEVDNHKSIFFAEICRRDLAYEISRYRDVIEARMKYYYKFIEGDR
jgi:hypothetical protein